MIGHLNQADNIDVVILLRYRGKGHGCGKEPGIVGQGEGEREQVVEEASPPFELLARRLEAKSTSSSSGSCPAIDGS